MTARLAIDERNRYGEFRIGWYLPEEGQFGLMLGDGKYTESQLRKIKDRDHRENALAYLAAIKTEGCTIDSTGIWWESRRAAQKALRAIKAAIANADHPWPEWAIKAKAEGWTPPKGWKP